MSTASSPIVIDSNLAVWAVLPNVAVESTVDLLANWHRQRRRIVAPDLWLAEATSVIRRLVFHKVISPAQGKVAIDDLFSLGVETILLDQQLYQNAFEWAEKLQQSKIYDSLYVALAEHLQAELWTADKRLVNGAKQAGIRRAHWVGEGK
ncbi:MAG TPA: type II toxin-antitoxin system VapC family toxin [Chloroflexi bacterium]|nr:type II toxin-antitoxin system VapC family toxin [Chloroflexota bacterium]